MKQIIFYTSIILLIFSLSACQNDENSTRISTTNFVLEFNNTFKGIPIVLGGVSEPLASVNTSVLGQEHQFNELKYVISNIRLIDASGREYEYFSNDLDKGAFIVDQSKPSSFTFFMTGIPTAEYIYLKFGLGVHKSLNILDQELFPEFYALAEQNDTEMMWDWGTGYRFTKIEGFYGKDRKELSIHTGSTVEEIEGEIVQGVDAYRDITLSIKHSTGSELESVHLFIEADLDFLLSNPASPIMLSSIAGSDLNATPNVHSALQMQRFINNIAPQQNMVGSGMFSLVKVGK